MTKRRPRGTGTVYEEGNRWAVRWQEGKTRRGYAGGFKTREEAERHGTIARATYLAKGSSPVALVAGKLTLSDHGKAFLERRKTTHEAGEEDAYRWNRHIAPGLGHLRPDDVDAAEMRRFIHDRLNAGCSPGPKHCRYGSRSRATGRDKGAETLERRDWRRRGVTPRRHRKAG